MMPVSIPSGTKTMPMAPSSAPNPSDSLTTAAAAFGFSFTHTMTFSETPPSHLVSSAICGAAASPKAASMFWKVPVAASHSALRVPRLAFTRVCRSACAFIFRWISSYPALPLFISALMVVRVSLSSPKIVFSTPSRCWVLSCFSFSNWVNILSSPPNSPLPSVKSSRIFERSARNQSLAFSTPPPIAPWNTLRKALPDCSPFMPSWSIITSIGAKTLVASSPLMRRMSIAGDSLVNPCSMLSESTPR